MSLHIQNPAISKLARMIMHDGKMHTALRIIDTAFSHLRFEHGIEQPAAFTEQALMNARPLVEVKKYKVAGRSLQVPVPCRPARQESLACRFVRDAFRERKERGSGIKLAEELLELERKEGGAWKRRQDLHRRAEQNRAFAHFLQ